MLYGLNYKPELIGIGKYSGELADGLAALGHEVRVVTAFPYYPQWKVQHHGGGFYNSAEEGGIHVTRCPLYVPRQPTGLKRLLHLASFALSSGPVAVAAALRFRPDLVFAVMPTLVAAPFAILGARLAGARSWLHVQDMEVDAAFQIDILKSKLAARAAYGLERSLLRRFSKLSTISPEMRERLQAKFQPTWCQNGGPQGASECRPEFAVKERGVSLLPNWVDTDEIRPLDDLATARTLFEIPQNAFVALYAGNMNRKQGLQIFPELANGLAAEPKILLVLAGDGPMRSELETALTGRPNVRFLPLQPSECFNSLLNCADVHLLPQRPEASGLVLPSKLAPILASGRPVVAVAPHGSALGDAVQGCGIVTPTLNASAFETAIRQMLQDPESTKRFGRLARTRAVDNWSKQAILEQFEEELQSIAKLPYDNAVPNPPTF